MAARQRSTPVNECYLCRKHSEQEVEATFRIEVLTSRTSTRVPNYYSMCDAHTSDYVRDSITVIRKVERIDI